MFKHELNIVYALSKHCLTNFMLSHQFIIIIHELLLGVVVDFFLSCSHLGEKTYPCLYVAPSGFPHDALFLKHFNCLIIFFCWIIIVNSYHAPYQSFFWMKYGAWFFCGNLILKKIKVQFIPFIFSSLSWMNFWRFFFVISFHSRVVNTMCIFGFINSLWTTCS